MKKNWQSYIQNAKKQVSEFMSIEDARNDPAHYLVCVYDHMAPEAQEAFDNGEFDEYDLATW